MNKLFLLSSFAAVLIAFSAHGQSFTDLNFESAQIVPVSTNGGSLYVATANALPGWNAFVGTSQPSSIAFDPSPAGVTPALALFGGSGNPVIDGNFSAGLFQNASITQTDFVPANTVSLLFDVALGNSMPFTVSLDGQDLLYSAISNVSNTHGPNYIVYGADVSAFAGQVETLTFSADTGHGGGGILDDIQFSTIAVPEPSIISLVCLAGGMLILARRRFQPKRAKRSHSTATAWPRPGT